MTINRGKVILTKEQSVALENLLKTRTRQNILAEKFNPFAQAGIYAGRDNIIVFKEIDTDTLVEALYFGYEIEENKQIYEAYLNGEFYGSSDDINYMEELFKDYVVDCDMYGKDNAIFEVKRRWINDGN